MSKLVTSNGNKLWVYVISLVERSMPMDWFFTELIKRNQNVLIVFLNPAAPPLMQDLADKGLNVHWIKYAGKMDMPFVFLKLFKLFRRLKPSVLHVHLFDACLIALPAGAFAGIKRRIHTRHHSSHHHYFFPHAVWYDRFVNFWSTSILAISENVKNILVTMENVPSSKVTVIHHGFDFDIFSDVSSERISAIMQKYDFVNKSPVIGVVSRYTYWKGIQYVIAAFEKLLKSKPNAILVLANAKGDYAVEITDLLKTLPSSTYRQIVFEADTPALFKSFDVFVHVPIDNHSEAFGQVYIESLIAKVPSVFTLSGIANEFIANERNAMVVDYMNSNAILNAIVRLIDEPDLVELLVENGFNDVKEMFDVKRMVSDTIVVYES
jgi:glycosyltransferase involved in cell wall biosynthesis